MGGLWCVNIGYGREEARAAYEAMTALPFLSPLHGGRDGMAGQAERKIGFGPQPPGYLHVPPPYAYRRPAGVTVEQHGAEVCRQLERRSSWRRADRRGLRDGARHVRRGVLVPTSLRDVRRICDKYGVLLILGEVVSGFGRAGAMFGHQRAARRRTSSRWPRA
ncbi:4-aminobutyrate:pyruvate transaminase [Aureococcus anophagefferens]|nr:4-aminobutyrate:pyruvate transaminase [Aureococcus anophagefferens]